MKHVLVAIMLIAALGIAPAAALAQTPPPAAPPQQLKPPVTTPPAAQTPPPAAQAPLVFPAGAKVAYLNPQRILSESVLGKASSARMNALRTQKLNELTAKNKELEAAQKKVAGGTLMTQDAAAAAQKAVERLQIEIERAQQDADAAMQELQQQLNIEFDRALAPLVSQIATEKGVQILLRLDTGAIAWADPSLDLTAEVVKRLDAAKPAAPAK